jgi:hypothetical protein
MTLPTWLAKGRAKNGAGRSPCPVRSEPSGATSGARAKTGQFLRFREPLGRGRSAPAGNTLGLYGNRETSHPFPPVRCRAGSAAGSGYDLRCRRLSGPRGKSLERPLVLAHSRRGKDLVRLDSGGKNPVTAVSFGARHVSRSGSRRTSSVWASAERTVRASDCPTYKVRSYAKALMLKGSTSLRSSCTLLLHLFLVS